MSAAVEHVTSDPVFAFHRTELFTAITERINFGLNPPLGLRDHRTTHPNDQVTHHASMQLERPDDVMAWARSFGTPISATGAELGDDPHVWEHGEGDKRRRITSARVELGDGRSIVFQCIQDLPAAESSDADR